MREVWGCRVCLVLCRSGDLVESADIRAWHSQRFLEKER